MTARTWRNTAVAAYPLVASADAVATLAGARRLRMITKPLILIALAVAKPPTRPSLALGLAASWVGDVALLGRGERHFRIGLAAFLVAHLGYARTFAATAVAPRYNAVAPIAAVTAFGAWGFGRAAKELSLPVRCYAIAIGTMAAAASTLRGQGGRRVLAGAVLFMLSDALIGASRFLLPARWAKPADFAVMVTYCGAQWLIHDGLSQNHDPDQ